MTTKTATRSFVIAGGILLLLVAGSLAVIPSRKAWFAVLLIAAMLFAVLLGYFWNAHIATRTGLLACTAEVGAALTAAGTLSQGLERCAQLRGAHG